MIDLPNEVDARDVAMVYFEARDRICKMANVGHIDSSDDGEERGPMSLTQIAAAACATTAIAEASVGASATHHAEQRRRAEAGTPILPACIRV